MTTIATDGRTIAADGASFFGWERATHVKRKLMVRDGLVFGLSGNGSMLPPLMAWYASGHVPKDVPKDSEKSDGWSLVVASVSGIIQLSDSMLYPFEARDFTATGSGSSYAMGAMAHGASPLEAVRIAAGLDAFTGGDIQVIDLKTLVETIYCPDGRVIRHDGPPSTVCTITSHAPILQAAE
jgi:hypothetical protein